MSSKVSCTPWQDLLLGSATTYSATYDECAPDTVVISTNAVTASGATSDNQEIVYQELCGDGQLIAKVSTLSGGYAGLFVRESNAAGARKGAIMTQKGSTVFRHLRSTTNGLQFQASYMASGHQWLKINRSGTQVIGSWSTNGTSWNVAFNTALSMTDCVVIGMAAFSTSSGTTINATFTNISVAQSDTIPATEVAFADSTLEAQGGDTVQICVNLQNPCYCSPVTVDVELATDSLPHLIGFEVQTLTFEEGDTVQCFTVVLAESDTNGTYTFELANLEGGNESEIGAIGELVLEVEANEEEEEEAPAFGVCGKFYKAPPEITDSSALLFSDRFGNIYLAEELALPESLLEACDCDEFTDIPHFEENYFELHFQDCIADIDTGFNDNVLGAGRRRAACRAFAYLSHLIQRNANPCDEEAELPKIKVHIKTMPTSNSQPLAGATPVYEFSYYASNGGIIDGLPWKIINNPGYSNQSNEIYHGIVEVNFNNNYHLGDTSDVPVNQFDLYTVMLHEGLHVLGFASAIKILDGGYLLAGLSSYTRYDTHLKLEDGTPLVMRHATLPYRWILNPAIDVETDLHASCTDDPGPKMEFGSFYDMLKFPIYTGDYTTGQDESANQGASFSHLNDSCAGALAPYLMDPFIPIGERLDLIEEGEKRILCDLGYRILDMEDCSCSVAGNHDPVMACSEDLFRFSLCRDSTSFTIHLEDILGNDVGADSIAFIYTNNFNNSEIVDNHDGTVTLTACASGDHSFRYTPMSTTCPQEGNSVIVTVFVERCEDCSFFSSEDQVPKTNQCNLICNPHVVAYSEGEYSLSVSNIECPSVCLDIPGWFSATQTVDYATDLDATIASIPSGSLSYQGTYSGSLTTNVESANTPLSIGPGEYFLSFQTAARRQTSDTTAFNFAMNAKLVDEGITNQFSTCENIEVQVHNIDTTEGNQLSLIEFATVSGTSFQRAATCFSLSSESPLYTSLWLYPKLSANANTPINIHVDEVEVIPDNFTAGEDRDFYECDTLLALGGADFCMLSNMRVRYTWKTLADSTLLEYETEIDTLGALTVWVEEETGDNIPELLVLPSETTTYILMREIVSEGFEDFAECFAAQDSVTVTFIETFPYELSVYDTSACNLIRGFEVTGGGGPFAWNFGDGQSTTTTSGQITHLYTNADNYTVTVTLPEHPGCSLTDTVNVSATVLTGGFSYSIGDCGEVDFLASDAHANNYVNLWNFGDGDGFDTTFASVTHTYAAADSFIVVVHTIYNECGEPFTAVDTLIIPPFLPEVEASVTLDSTTCNLFSFEAAGNADSLTWFFPGDSIYVGDSIAFEFDEPGIYEIVLEAANECGTVSTVLTVVATNCEAIDCCPDGAVVLAGNLLLSDVIEADLLNPGSTSENICIQGILTIDTNYVFSSDTITLDAGSSIVIQSGSNLSINLALLQGCEFLWNNILVQDGASLMVRSSIFRDATNAIEARNGSDITVTGSTFENNITGIYVPGLDTNQIVTHSIVNNDFIFTAQHLKPSLTLFGPFLFFPIPLAGIQVHNVDFVVSGPPPAGPSDNPVNAASTNRFKGLYCGIRAFNSNLVVSGAQFEDIVEIPAAGFSFTSAAIYFDGTNAPTGSTRSLLQPETTEVLPEALEVRLYPNPAKNGFTVSFNQPLQEDLFLVLTDLYGRRKITRVLNSGTVSFYINTEDEPSGLYGCSIQSTMEVLLFSKIVITH
ncbi:MAG: PKD domain-containing protein [Saprospiraceae bacterium]